MLGLLAVGLAALFVRLGVWQLHRLDERKVANAGVASALAAPVARLTAADVGPAALRRLLWRRVDAEGRFDPGRELIVRGRAWRGSPGVELLAPLALRGGGEVWVDRGWVPSPDAEHVDRGLYLEPDDVRVRGFLRPPARGEAPPGRSLAAILEQLPDSSLVSPPVRRGPPELSGGPHLSYAVQWFAFAATALVGYAAYLWSRRPARPTPRQAAPPDQPPFP